LPKDARDSVSNGRQLKRQRLPEELDQEAEHGPGKRKREDFREEARDGDWARFLHLRDDGSLVFSQDFVVLKMGRERTMKNLHLEDTKEGTKML
jgi:hypothetical protein